METAIKILLVEDEANFAAVMKSYLELSDFTVDHCDDGQKGYDHFMKNEYDLCILDVMMPEMDGFTLAKKIKDLNPTIPLIFLTAKTLKEDIIQGYKIGADDYITKPFDSELLIYKLKAILNRNLNEENGNSKNEFKIGNFVFIPRLRTLTGEDEEFKLSPKESELLKLLCESEDEVLPRTKALKVIWGDDNFYTTRSMDVYITKLRKYLKKDASIKIENIHGSGFRLLSLKQ
ncbi:response regulator transcription factor [Ancylomarina sp. YFZ004]